MSAHRQAPHTPQNSLAGRRRVSTRTPPLVFRFGFTSLLQLFCLYLFQGFSSLTLAAHTRHTASPAAAARLQKAAQAPQPPHTHMPFFAATDTHPQRPQHTHTHIHLSYRQFFALLPRPETFALQKMLYMLICSFFFLRQKKCVFSLCPFFRESSAFSVSSAYGSAHSRKQNVNRKAPPPPVCE